MLARSVPLVAVAALAVACGGDTTAFATATTEAGAGGGSAAGSTSAGGSGQAGAGQGAGGVGQAGTGSSSGGSGATGAGGAGAIGAGGVAQGGAAGAASDAGPCPAPVRAGDTAICLTFSPEDIKAENDAALDKRGVFIVQIFDTPTPPKNAGSIALFERVIPADSATGGQISIDALRPIRAVAAFPSTVYVRAVFVDNPGPFATGDLGYGSWVGGVNFLDGIQKNEPLEPVQLDGGQGNAVDVALVALRKLDVTVHTSATPIGDGQGPFGVVVVNEQDPAMKPPPVGFAAMACADVTKGDLHLTGFFVGSGQHWVTGILKDITNAGDFPPGSLAALAVNGQKYSIPTSITVAPTAYSASVTIDLSFLVPYPADAGAPPPNSCADLGIGGDAGP